MSRQDDSAVTEQFSISIAVWLPETTRDKMAQSCTHTLRPNVSLPAVLPVGGHGRYDHRGKPDEGCGERLCAIFATSCESILNKK